MVVYKHNDCPYDIMYITMVVFHHMEIYNHIMENEPA